MSDKRGFSLLQVMIAAGVMGGLSLILVEIVSNVHKTQVFVEGNSELIELRTSIRMILDNENYCRVSLAGDGPSGSPSSPVVFEKKDIDEEATEGLNVSLYYANQAGTARTLKQFNGQDNPGVDDKSSIGKLIIKSMKLVLPNPPGGAADPNYSNSPNHSDSGVLKVLVEKIGFNSRRREVTLDFPMNVVMSTGQSPESSGQTRLLSCTRESLPPVPPAPSTSFTLRFVSIMDNDFWTPGTNSRVVTPQDTFTRTITCPDEPGRTFQFRTCEGACRFTYCQSPPSFCSGKYNGIISSVLTGSNPKECKIDCSSGSNLSVMGNWVIARARCYYK